MAAAALEVYTDTPVADIQYAVTLEDTPKAPNECFSLRITVPGAAHRALQLIYIEADLQTQSDRPDWSHHILLGGVHPDAYGADPEELALSKGMLEEAIRLGRTIAIEHSTDYELIQTGPDTREPRRMRGNVIQRLPQEVNAARRSLIVQVGSPQDIELLREIFAAAMWCEYQEGDRRQQIGANSEQELAARLAADSQRALAEGRYDVEFRTIWAIANLSHARINGDTSRE